MKSGYTIDLHSKTITATTVTIVVVVLLIFDGVIPHLPFYDLRAQNSLPLHLYFTLQLLTCIVCQVIYIWVIKTSLVSRFGATNLRKDTRITFYSVLTVQFAVIALLLVILFHTEIMKEYNSLAVTISILLSIFLSTCLTGILALRFFLWLKYGRDRIVFAYAIAMLMITLSSLVLSALILSEMRFNRSIIDSSRIAISTANITDFKFKEFQSYLSGASFVAFWFASVLLLSQTKNKWKNLKFLLFVAIPLAYYFGVFQLLLSAIFVHFDLLNAIQDNMFNLLNSILTRSIGGVLFGVAFWKISSTVKDLKIKYYLRLSSFGIILLAVSNVDTGIFMLPYPPFGLVTLSFLGISSYLLLVGIYSSAISISVDHKVRASIHNSVENELRFVSKIGNSQMQQQIENRVKKTTKKLSAELEENSGIKPTLEGKELEDYISFVLTERDQISKKRPGKE